MSEADADAERKAKAARAKAILAKKRQADAKKKAATGVSTPSIAPSSPASTANDVLPSARTSLNLDDSVRPGLNDAHAKSSVTEETSQNVESEKSLAQLKNEEEDKTDTTTSGTINHDHRTENPISGQVERDGDASEQEVEKTLTPIDDEEKRKATQMATPKAANADTPSTPTDGSSIANLQQTVTLLIAERSDLQNQVSKLESSLNTARGDSKLLTEGRQLTEQLEREKRDLEIKLEETETKASRVEDLERSTAELERHIEELTGERERLRGQLDGNAEERRKEVEEKDSQLREAEKSLERSRERQSGLEAELGRLRNNNGSLESKVIDLEKQLDILRESSSSTTQAHAELQTDHQVLQDQFDSLQSSHDELRKTHSKLQASHTELEASHTSSSTSAETLQKSLSEAQSELSEVKTTLSTVTKRADAAEKRSLALQSENDELVSQLEEVRGKVVTIMEEKVEYIAEFESLQSRSKKDFTELEEKRRRVEELENQISAKQEPSVDDSKTVNYELEISSQREKIRSLESALHNATTKIHTLTKQLSETESSLLDDRPSSAGSNVRPGLVAQRSVDMILPPSVRHKRQVSLAGLKARMGSEGTRKSSSLSGVVEVEEVSSVGIGRKQFGDEIMFCCPACEGDLITL